MALRVGFVGIGNMGGPIAGHIGDKGFAIAIHDRLGAKMDAWAKAHRGRTVGSCAAAAADADVFYTCVVTEDHLREATVGPEGAYAHLKRGAVHVDHSTTGAAIAKELAARAAERGIAFVDAPVAGAEEGARKGILSVMAGGDAKALATVRPVMETYARVIQHVGPNGHGQLTKMMNQIVIAGIIQGLGEGLTFGHHAGLDMDRVVELLRQGTADNWWLEVRSPQMLDNLRKGRDVNYGRAGLLIKDLAICLAEARRNDFGLPTSGLISQLPVQIGPKRN